MMYNIHHGIQVLLFTSHHHQCWPLSRKALKSRCLSKFTSLLASSTCVAAPFHPETLFMYET